MYGTPSYEPRPQLKAVSGFWRQAVMEALNAAELIQRNALQRILCCSWYGRKFDIHTVGRLCSQVANMRSTKPSYGLLSVAAI
jgi:hypothetical protein